MKTNLSNLGKFHISNAKQPFLLFGVSGEKRIQVSIGFDEGFSLLGSFKKAGAIICSDISYNRSQESHFNQELQVCMKLFEAEVALVHDMSFSSPSFVSCKQNSRHDVKSAAML